MEFLFLNRYNYIVWLFVKIYVGNLVLKYRLSFNCVVRDCYIRKKEKENLDF